MIKLMCLIISLSLVQADDKLLKNFKTCRRSDPKLNQCLKEAIQKALQFLEFGVPEFNIPSMQPFELPNWVINPTKSLPFIQTYKNVRVYNSTNCVINKLEAEVTDSKFSITLTGFNPSMKFVAAYNFENAIMFGMNISGNGTIVIAHFGNSFSMNVTGNSVKDGDKIKLVTRIELHLDVEHIDLTLENQHLEFSKEKTSHANKHRNTLYEELQAEYCQLHENVYNNFADSVFSKLGFDEFLVGTVLGLEIALVWLL